MAQRVNPGRLLPLLLILPVAASGQEVSFLRGDADSSGGVNLTDPILALQVAFLGSPDPLPCDDAADANDDGKLQVTDSIYTLGYLFLAGPAPPEPSAACGPDPTADSLSCLSHPPCASAVRYQEVWTVRHDRLAALADGPGPFETGPDGSLYLSVFSWMRLDSTDLALLRYGPQGDRLWEARYGGPLGKREYAADMEVDAHGGVHFLLFSADECVLLRFGPDGRHLWTARDGLIARDWSTGHALTVDDQGSAFVTGWEQLPELGNIIFIRKFSSDGALLWSTRRILPVPLGDTTGDLAVDREGNVFVVGMSAGDFLTLKYSPEGRELWARTFDGVGRYGQDWAQFVAIDGEGNPVVAGESDSDYFLIKYDPAGEVLWTARHSAAFRSFEDLTDLRLHADGSPVLTGRSSQAVFGQTWVFTARWSPSGDLAWSEQILYQSLYSSPVPRLFLGRDGSTWTLCGLENGQLLWLDHDPIGVMTDRSFIPADVTVPGVAMRLDLQGNLFFHQYRDGDVGIVKYDPSPKKVWEASYGTSANDDEVLNGLGVDREGNLLLAGKSTIGFTFIKYGPDGRLAWERSPFGPYLNPTLVAMRLDADGDILATFGGRLRRIDPTGKVDNTSSTYYTAYSISVLEIGPPGRVFLAGPAIDGGLVALEVEKEHGRVMKEFRRSGLAVKAHRSQSLALGADGSVHLSGLFRTSGDGHAVETVKFAESGEQLWSAHLEVASGGDVRALPVVLDGAGNLYLAVQVPDQAARLIKYGPDGALQWEGHAAHAGTELTQLTGLSVSVDGSSYLSGSFDGFTQQGPARSLGTVRHDPEGSLRWLLRHPAFRATADQGAAQVMDARGRLFVTARSGAGLATVVLDPEGMVLWSARHFEGLPALWGAGMNRLDAQGNLFVAATIHDPRSHRDIVASKYAPLPDR